LILAVLIKTVVLSFRRRSVPCIDGTKWAKSVMFTLMTTVSRPGAPVSGVVNGLPEDGLCVSVLMDKRGCRD